MIEPLSTSSHSASSAYTDLTWITTLVSFVSTLPSVSPKLKIIGICFGHQIIARAFGSTVEVNEVGGWEVGVRKIELTNVGKEVFGGDELVSLLSVLLDATLDAILEGRLLICFLSTMLLGYTSNA